MRCGCLPDLRASLERRARALLARGCSRREALRLMGAALSAALSGCATIPERHRAEARELAREHLSVDLHAHAGMLPISPRPMEEQIARMEVGRVRVALFSAVADGPLLGRRPGGGLHATREPRPGELEAATWRQVDRVRSRISGGRLRLVRGPADLDALVAGGAPGALLAAEGGDFLEGRLERVEAAHRQGLRSLQLVHYRINELGDIQTEPPRHGGLTPFGREVIREMNRLGMVVDLAHLTWDGVRAAVAATRKPVILSHTVLATPFARSVSREHAELVARTGGLIGIFPVNSGYHGFAGYITHLERMIAAVGADHVGVGTDMDGIWPPSFLAWDDYREWPSVGAALLARGHSRETVARVLGDNFRRVFAEVAAV